MFRPFRRRADVCRRFLAAGIALLVFALGVFAASPALHDWLHSRTGTATDDGCAIVLFAGGVSVPLAVTALPPSVEWSGQSYGRSKEIFLDSPRYLLQPGRGPPVG